MKKNILIFGHAYATQFIDISNQYTQLFDKRFYDVTIVYLVDEPNEEVRKRHLADHVIFLNTPSPSTRGLKIFAIKKMLKLTREKQFEIVICHRYKPSYVMLWVALFIKIPTMIFVMHELKTMKNLSRKLLIASLWRNNMLFAGVSDAVRDDVRRDIWRVPKDHVITLYNAIDVHLTEPDIIDRTAARGQLNLAPDDFVFGAIGRLAPAKDPQTLIQAFSLIKPYCPNAKLIMLGRGDLESSLKQKISELRLENEVILAGFIPKAFSLMKAFDLFILNSIKEAFGRVLLEAMIAKVPIIATKVNGIPEVVAESGELIDAANVTQLAEKMLFFYKMNHHELAQWGERGYRRATQLFSTDHFKQIFWQLPLLKSEGAS